MPILPISDELLEAVSVFQHKDYGDLMLRAANMKITVKNATGRVANVSGGGPDFNHQSARRT